MEKEEKEKESWKKDKKGEAIMEEEEKEKE